MTLTNEQLTSAARGFVLDPDVPAQAFEDALSSFPDGERDELFRQWTHVPGVAHTVGDLALFCLDFADADGPYEALLAEGLGMMPNPFGVNLLHALMMSRGDVAPVAAMIADAIERVHEFYLLADDDDNARELARRVRALREGPLPEGGYLPSGYWHR